MARAASKILSVEDKKDQIRALRGEAKMFRESMKALRADRVIANKAAREAAKAIRLLDKDIAADQKQLDKVLDKIKSLA